MSVSIDQLPPDLVELIGWGMQRIAPASSQPTPRPASGQDPEHWRQEVAAARAQHDAAALHAGRLQRMVIPAPERLNVQVGYATIPVAGGVISARVYRPTASGPHPAVVLFHGGAYWMGGGAVGFELNDELCRRYSDEGGAVVLNVDYRLAPEFPAPTPLEDAYAAIKWTADNAAQLDIDADRIVVHGISSGGNLAAAVSQLAFDRSGPRLRGQILQMPSLDLSDGALRVNLNPQLRDDVERLVAMYVGDLDAGSPSISPALRDDLTGLPPAYLITATYDELCADASRYAERLTAAGVPTQLNDYPATHTVATPEVVEQMAADLITAFLEMVRD